MKAAPRKITGFRYSIENVHFTPDGKGLYARDNGGHSIKFSDFTTTQEVIKSSDVKINSTDLRADGLKLAGAGNNGILYIWDIRDNYKATEIKLGGSLTSVTWHPTEDLLVVGDNLGLIRLIKNGIVVRLLSGHRGPIEQIKYNHNATFFASASKDRTVRLWNVNKLTIPPIELKDHLDWVWTLTFSPDDEQIMVGLQSSQQTIDRDKLRNEASIRAYPTKIATMSDILCEQYIKQNMNKEDWETYVPGLDWEKTCPNLPDNNN
jgi:WD40 repeat protein